MITIKDQADLEVSQENLAKILDLAEIPDADVWPRYQLRPGRPCLAINGDYGVLNRFLLAAGAVLDYDHALDLFGLSHYIVLRSGARFHAFPEVLVEDLPGPDFQRPVEG